MIQGGTHQDLDELIEDIEFGVYACGSKRPGRYWQRLVPIRCTKAWIIENGSLSRPVKDVSVSG